MWSRCLALAAIDTGQPGQADEGDGETGRFRHAVADDDVDGGLSDRRTVGVAQVNETQTEIVFADSVRVKVVPEQQLDPVHFQVLRICNERAADRPETETLPGLARARVDVDHEPCRTALAAARVDGEVKRPVRTVLGTVEPGVGVERVDTVVRHRRTVLVRMRAKGHLHRSGRTCSASGCGSTLDVELDLVQSGTSSRWPVHTTQRGECRQRRRHHAHDQGQCGEFLEHFHESFLRSCG